MTTFPSSVVDRTDWVELSLLVGGEGRLGKSRLREAIADRAPELGDAGLEEAVDDVFQEVRRRRNLAGDLYPFLPDRTAIVRRGLSDEVEALYAFLALNSALADFRVPKPGFTSGLVFEKVVASALARWSGGEALVFADVPAGEDAGVREALKRLGKRLALESYPERVRKARKDHGLDVAAWRPFPDRRAGHPILLCQCTVGWELVRKAREVLPAEWSQLLHAREGIFSASLAVPHVLPPDYERWLELRNSTDLIVDRLRLLSLLDEGDEPWKALADHSAAIADGLKSWAEAE